MNSNGNSNIEDEFKNQGVKCEFSKLKRQNKVILRLRDTNTNNNPN